MPWAGDEKWGFPRGTKEFGISETWEGGQSD